MEIKKIQNKTFRARLNKTPSVEKAEKYAHSIGESELYKEMRKNFKKIYKQVEVSVNARHNIKPCDCIRIVINSTNIHGTQKNKLDYTISKISDIGEITYNTLKELFNPKSDLHKKVFSIF